MNEDETSEAIEAIEASKIVYANEMKMEMEMSVKAGWKVMGFGLA